jgi:hypothetical protein
MSKYLTLTKDVVKNSNIKYNDIRKVQQIIAEKGDLVFVSSDYEDKEVPKDQIIKLYDKILEDQMKYDERQKYDKNRVEDIVIDVVHTKQTNLIAMTEPSVINTGCVSLIDTTTNINSNSIIRSGDYRCNLHIGGATHQH